MGGRAANSAKRSESELIDNVSEWIERKLRLYTEMYATDTFLGTKLLPSDPRDGDQIIALRARTRLFSNARLDSNPIDPSLGQLSF